MARIQSLEPAQADPKARELLEAAKKKMGRIPNILGGLANSPTALEAYMTLSGVLGTGTLSARLREQIALVTAGANGCGYCASAHTAIGGSLKIDGAELSRNLNGESSDPGTAAVLSFARSVLSSRGHVSDDEFQAIRAAGFTDGQLAEIVANISLSVLTNFFNGVADTEVDFPRVEIGEANVA